MLPRRFSHALAVLTAAALAAWPLVASGPAQAADDSPLGAHPNLSVASSNLLVYPPYRGRDNFRVDLDITASVPDACASGDSCGITIRWMCLNEATGLSWSYYDMRDVTFTGSELRHHYHSDVLSGCYVPNVAHAAFVDLHTPTITTTESILLEFSDFPIAWFVVALADKIRPTGDYPSACGSLEAGTAMRSACVTAATAPIDALRPHRMAAAVLAAGGTAADLISMLGTPGSTYVDPIPPAPAGDEIVDGYDVDAIASNIDAAGGLALLAVLASTVPSQNSNGGSTNDLAETVMAAEKNGLTTRQAVQLLVNTAGAGVLVYLVAADFAASHPNGSGPTTPAPQPRPWTPAVGGNRNAPRVVVEPDDATVNEVLRAWSKRISDGKLGNSSVATDQPDLLPEESLRTVARQCLKNAAAAARAGATFTTSNPCRDERILVPAGTGDGRVPVLLDAHEAALHDREAMTTRPEWFQLNYMSVANKTSQTDRLWYQKEPYWASSGCKASKGTAAQCDEYPLFATTQGGPVATGGSGASLKPINPDQNQAEGRVYGAMVSSKDKCEMQSAPPVPKGTHATGGTPFLVVPMPDLPIPSFFLC